MKRSVFRRAALERLSSPEQLDQLMRVTTPRGWLALLALCGLLVGALSWALWGEATEQVWGYGILLRAGGVTNLEARVSGLLTEIYVDIGDEIEDGQVVARIAQEGKIAGTKVISPHTGRVIEIKVDEASLVERGTAILSMELTGKDLKDLEAIVYVPPAEGKRILPGMDAKVSPETIQKQEYGFILGKVTSVGKYPATYQGMLRTLGNEDLVQALRAEGEGLSPIEVRIQLTPSERGYRWNSRREPNVDIQSGTPCFVEIVINKDRHPIDLILPQ
jgi:multidrug resistance efflux pump